MRGAGKGGLRGVATSSGVGVAFRCLPARCHPKAAPTRREMKRVHVHPRGFATKWAPLFGGNPEGKGLLGRDPALPGLPRREPGLRRAPCLPAHQGLSRGFR